MKRKESRVKKIPESVKSVAELVSAVIVIGGALIGAGQWIVHEINLSTNARMDKIEDKIDDNQNENKLAIMRLELMNLIQNTPDNVIEIEKYAKEYFRLGGNRYMTGMVSKWCEEHNVNCGEILLK